MSEAGQGTDLAQLITRALRRGLVLALALGCTSGAAESSSALRVQFGIFYGGQVQEREELPLELDRSRQIQGLRMQLDPAPSSPLEVSWEVGLPGSGPFRRDSRGRRERRRRTRLGQALWRAGESRFEQPIAFRPGDPTGLWSVRARLGSRLVLDRAVWVYDQRRREASLRRAAELDGGF